MADKKISALDAIVTVDNADVLPIVDSSASATKKITVTQIKALAPVQSVNGSTGSVTVQETLVSGTNIKTINGDSLLGSGNITISGGGGISDGDKGDITVSASGATWTIDNGVVTDSKLSTGIDAAKLGDGTVSNAEFQYLNGVTSAIQTQLDGKVDENAAITGATKTKITYDAKGLVTAGDDLAATDLPSGIDAAKIADGTISNTEFQYLNGVTDNIQTQFGGKQETLVSGTNLKTINSTSLLGSGDISISASPSGGAGAIQFSDGSAFASDASNLFWDDTNKRLGVGTNTPTARVHIKGSGSLSGTTSLLVQNSLGTSWLQVKDDGDITNGADGNTNLKFEISPSANKYFRLTRQSTNVDFYAGNGGNAGIETSGGQPFSLIASSTYLTLSNGGVRIASAYGTTSASAQLEVVSTTKGFLPPRMTTTQKNAISSPASGLVVYDSTTNKLCCYNGTSWNDLF